MGLTPAVVLPVLRGSYGREYHYAEVTETTQRMLPADASHGAVALAERQTAGRGRMGRTWVDSALMFSVALYPPQPVAHWPRLTLVAAEAVAGAVGPAAAIKHPNDVLIDGRKVAGILAEAAERVVLGIGINVGARPGPAPASSTATGSSCSSTCWSGSSTATSNGRLRGHDRAEVPGCVLRLGGERGHAPLERDREHALRLGDHDSRRPVDEHGHRRRLVEAESQR